MAKTKNPSPKLNRKQLRKLQRAEKKKRKHKKPDSASVQASPERPRSRDRNSEKSVEKLKPPKSHRNAGTSVECEAKPIPNSDELKLKKLQRSMHTERIKRLKEDNAREDKLIRSLEKKMKLKTNKKGLPSKSFVDEGLDYLLEVCDFEKYKGNVNLEAELNDADMKSEFVDDLHTVASNKMDKTPVRDIERDKPTDESNDEKEKVTAKKREKMDKTPVPDIERDKPDKSDDEKEKVPAKKRRKRDKTPAQDIERDMPDKSDDEKVVEKKSKKKAKRKRKKSDKTDVTKVKKLKEDIFLDEEENYSLDECDDEIFEDEDAENNSKEVLREDIYGRLRKEDGTVEENPTKYIPPQLRNKISSSQTDSEKLKRLNKQLKGLLNRLTGKNMHGIANQIEQMYGCNSRHDVNSTLTELLKESIISYTFSPMRIIIEHALLVSILHANVGIEVGSYVLQKYVEEYNALINEPTLPIEDKRIDNIIAVLVQLYNFKVFHACLIYEILDKLIERFGEKDIDLILLILKNVGFNLRKDDPSKLKEIIFKVQKKASSSSEHSENLRMKFMVEMLLAIKNNNKLKVLQSEADYIESLKKSSKAMLNTGKYVSELKITLDDLLNVESRGRWWIVGSAWQGSTSVGEKTSLKTDSSLTFDEKLLNLAKKHRMNTDVRKNIFCILMSAEDFMDAFEKLMKLGLKGNQCQEIIYVTMHCLLQEKAYNPYYSFIAEQFSSQNRKYQLAIQFCSWDKFKEIDSLNDQQITNLAQFLAYLIQNKKLSLSVLKVLQFTEMNKPMVRLMRQLLLSILLGNEEPTIAEVFASISKSDALFMLREGLQLFLNHFILKEAAKESSDGNSSQLLKLPKRVELAENAMRGVNSQYDFN